SVSFLIIDYIRKVMGYDTYDPTEQEAKRSSIEVRDYHERITNLQYLPSDEEVEFMWKHLPVQLDGEPSEKLNVSNYKGLERVETDRLRSGFCLIMGEGLTQKAPKIWKQLAKWGKEMNMEHWNFLEDFLKLQKKMKALEKKEEKKEDGGKLKPDYTYIKDMVAGRPVLGHPLRKGGFRLRYGRARNTGLSSCAINPATMVVLDDYIAIGTQLKMERPLKSTVISSCDSLEGPIVKLHDGSVLLLNDYEEAKKYNNDVEEIIFLGDILINYGDFLNRAHILVPPGYCEEWWLQELKNKVKDAKTLSSKIEENEDYCENLLNNFTTKVGFDVAKKISEIYNIPLHPRWTYHWSDINVETFKKILLWFNKVVIEKNKVILPLDYNLEEDIQKQDPKRGLELIGLPHQVVSKEYVVIKGDDAKAFCYILSNIKFADFQEENVLEIINSNCTTKIKDKSGLSIGTRMGRPEKAKMRKLKGNPHILFPVGEEGGKMRSLKCAIQKGKVEAQFPIFKCEKCNYETIYPYCEKCNCKTIKYTYISLIDKESKKVLKDEELIKEDELENRKKQLEENKEIKERPFKKNKLNIKEYLNYSLKRLGIKEYPEMIKGVRGTSNKDHTPENLAKGFLRSIHDIHVNKDGTVRYDMTEMAITAFKPREIGTSIEKLKELGYDEDIYGNELKNEDQILELRQQDVILPKGVASLEEGCDVIMFRVANFIDDLLEKFYKLPKFYNLKSKEDLVGHLVLGLAPHISAGMVARIVGFSETMGFYAHPVYHCAVRRDADGDEAAIILLTDALINFSKKYLPGHRGARQDAPLVMTPLINPNEVDDMVFDLDIVNEYPLEFYQACEQYKMPWDVKSIKKFGDNLGKPEQYFGIKFTHTVSSINKGSKCSAYKSIPTMQEKVLGQMQLAEKIRAVNESDVARLVVDRHFMRDIKGNLRKFSTQQFRCVDCNEKFRRPPLIGCCTKCSGKIIFTVSEGTIVKYLQPSLSLAEKFELPTHLRQSLNLTKMMIESIFGREEDKQEALGKWF
ncbi:DNA polymerase II large subunit, partial [archaeon]|nr:DNA polymerase II large subunit [archaeon]